MFIRSRIRTFGICGFLLLVSLSGCQSGLTPVGVAETTLSSTDSTPKVTHQSTNIPTTPIATTRKPPTVTTHPVDTNTQTMTVFPNSADKAGLTSRCLEILPSLPDNIDSTGVVVLVDQSSGESGSRPDTLLLNMETGQSTQVSLEGEVFYPLGGSPNREREAFSSIFFNEEGKIAKRDLVVTDTSGKRLIVIPWEEDWLNIPGWLDSEHLGIILDSPDPETNILRKPSPLLILNPNTDERRIVKPDYPGFLYTPSTVLPDWEGWAGVLYDPTISMAIYPHVIENNDEMFTYGIWDLSQQRLVTTLKDIFSTFVIYNFYPMPRWSPESTEFIFEGTVAATELSDKVEFELYKVDWDGQIEQLTELTDVAYIWDTSYSWSPDGRYIAFFIGPPLGANYEKARLAVLDTATNEVTDYCVSVSPRPVQAPLWSPDGNQLLLVDWYELNHQNIILVDPTGGFAVQLGEDLQPGGWLSDLSE